MDKKLQRKNIRTGILLGVMAVVFYVCIFADKLFQ
jgi:hypothetical protein